MTVTGTLGTLQRRPALAVACLVAAANGAVILVYALGWLPLSYSVQVLAPLSAVLYAALLARAGRTREDVFIDRLLGGLAAGAVGLVAYDAVRLLFLLSGQVPFNPFRPIEVYGLLILDRAEDTAATRAVGWAFHVWNGFSFATMYTMIVGRGRLLAGLLWGLMLEIPMVAAYPSIFRLVIDGAFLLVSLAGHVAYGLAVGATARRVVR